MQSLIRLRSSLQFAQVIPYIDNNNAAMREREEAYGEAYAIMLSIPDSQIQQVAKKVMQGNFNEAGNEKLDAIDEAIVRLSQLIDEIMRKR